MADRFKFAEVRQEVIEMLKKDLLGPSSENEILNQNPRFEYIVGMLAPQTSENDSNEQEIDGDASFEGDADYTAGEDDDNEPVFTNRFKTPSSIGISFYLESSTKSFNVDVTWGDYTKASDKTTNKEGRGVETSILSTCNNYKPRWKSNGVFFNRFFGGFVLRATLKSNFVASAMSCSIIEISLLRL